MREEGNVHHNKKSIIWDTIKLTVHYISKIFLWSIFLILVIAAITLIVYFVDLKRNIESGKETIPLFNAYVIISPSMEPAIKVQDAVIVMRTDVKKLEKNDVITFDSKDPRYSGITITHRIVGVENKGTDKAMFRTKGDNNNTDDTALVKGEDIYGKVILKLPKIGYIQYFLSQKFGWIIAIVIPCLAIIIYDIIKLIKTIRKGTRRAINRRYNDEDVPTTISSFDLKEKRRKELERSVEKERAMQRDKERELEKELERKRAEVRELEKKVNYNYKLNRKRRPEKENKNNNSNEKREINDKYLHKTHNENEHKKINDEYLHKTHNKSKDRKINGENLQRNHSENRDRKINGEDLQRNHNENKDKKINSENLQRNHNENEHKKINDENLQRNHNESRNKRINDEYQRHSREEEEDEYLEMLRKYSGRKKRRRR